MKIGFLNKIVLIITLLIFCGLSLFVGVAPLSIDDLLKSNPNALSLMYLIRIPRTVVLIIAGMGLSISGLIMQQMTQNKFVSPTTVGTLEAATLGVLASIFIVPESSPLIKAGFAFGFTFLGSTLFLLMVQRIRYKDFIFIPLVGLVFGGILNSISTFVAINLNIVQDVNAWMMGDFSGIIQGRYELVYLCLPALVITYLYANKFTVIGLGEDFSKNLGLNYKGVINLGLFCVSLCVSTVVITAGSIAFLGLVIPNIVTLMYGDNLKKNLPFIALWGAIFLIACDLIGRLIIFPFEVPIGLTVGVIGGLVFLILLLRKNRND